MRKGLSELHAESPYVPKKIRAYLNEIAERLWTGHAAIMVGAGFSKNAEHGSKAGVSFPTWAQLGDLFYEKIHGSKPDDHSVYLNVLKLADEVQAAFGRPTLNQILRDAIPDTAHEPSPLHAQLLNLPWSDVFTTNYDTLLERACVSVSSQKYDVVINKEDMVYSKKPRIIKLHGSFPSKRPFIITEEDYRRYPKDYAPFVNTVQQALLENTLCLIGFSGDDPNFLQWIGWIRDNLGREDSSKIYLVGMFNLSAAQVKLLEQRNIVLVNMAVCEDVNGDHYQALKTFLHYLESKKEEDNRLTWPSDAAHSFPKREEDKPPQVLEKISEWRGQREAYPGWVIVPNDRRNVLWNDTMEWVTFISENDKIDNTKDIEWAFELAWRMDKCLCPLIKEQIVFYEALLKKYLPLIEKGQGEEEELFEALKESELTTSAIQKLYFSLLLYMLRSYREDGASEKWDKTHELLYSHYNSLSGEQKSFLHYERVLQSLFRLNLEEIRSRLAAWKSDESLPFWEAKRAGLLAEIGEVDEAKRILEKSLKNIRSALNLQPITIDYSMVSQEAFVMVLLRYVTSSTSWGKGTNWDDTQEQQFEFSERWNVLTQYKCDPWEDIKIFETSLEQPYVEKTSLTKNKGFDIGRVTTTHHLRGWDKEALLAYGYLRFCEDAGIPFRIPFGSFGKKSAEGVLPRISKYSAYWAMATMVRVGGDDGVEHLFGREALCKMSMATADVHIHEYLKALDGCEEAIASGDGFRIDNFGVHLARIVPEVLSRLCSKCSEELKDTLLGFIIKVYASESRDNYRGMNHLVERFMGTLSQRRQFVLLPRLLEVQIPSRSNHITEREFVTPFLYLSLSSNVVTAWDSLKLPVKQLSSIIAVMKSQDEKARARAVLTFEKLHSLGLLNKKCTNEFAKALWARVDVHGLPAVEEFYRFAFILLPSPPRANPVALFKEFVFNTKFPIQQEGDGVSMTGGHVSICHELIGSRDSVEWSEEEVYTLFYRLVEWWDADKHRLLEKDEPRMFGSIQDEFKARFSSLVEVLEFVLIPYFNKAMNSETETTLKRLVGEFQEYDLPTIEFETSLLGLYPENLTETLNKIEIGLASIDHEDVQDSLKAVLTMVRMPELCHEESQLSKLIGRLGSIVFWRKKRG